MSLDIEVIPLVSSPIMWFTLRDRWIRCAMTDGARKLVGSRPVMVTPAVRFDIIDEDRVLDPPASYHFEIADSNTIGLSLHRNFDTYTNEEECLRDIARGRSEDFILELTSRWKATGYSFYVRTQGGRHRHEPSACAALAIALADLLDGYVVPIDDFYGICAIVSRDGCAGFSVKIHMMGIEQNGQRNEQRNILFL